MNRESIQVVIPAFNEEGAIGGVVRELHRRGFPRVRVVDNGSTDGTAVAAAEAGAEVVREERRGYGQACATGCARLSAEIDWILFCDADGCDDLDSLPKLLVAAGDGADLVIGNRRATPEGRANLTPVQNFGNWLAGFLLRLLFGQRFSDLGPMRLIRRSAYEKLGMRDRGFGWTVEMQGRAAASGLHCAEVPVSYFPRKAGVSKISGTLRGSVRAGTIILATIAAFARERLEPGFRLLAGALLVAGAFWMSRTGNFEDPAAVLGFLGAWGLMSLGFVVSWALRSMGPIAFLGLAVVLRLIVLPMEPGVDLWRYIWEGQVQNFGYSPYLAAPISPDLVGLRGSWWEKIHHVEVTAAYPPLAELLFRVLAWVSPTATFFKTVIAIADLGVVLLLWRRFGSAASLYAWNPLVIAMFAGGGHYDSLFLLFATAAWLLWERLDLSRFPPKTDVAKAIAPVFLLVGLSVALKYVTAPLAAFLLYQVWCRCGLRAALVGAVLVVVPSLFALAAFWGPFGVHPIAPAEFALVARSAEFFPRIVENWWPESIRLNAIYVVPFAVIVVWRIVRARCLASFAEETFLALYVLSPAVHAWYFTWAMPFAVASRNLGYRMISITAALYFLLDYRQALGELRWRQETWEMAAMWLPLIGGFAWSRWQSHLANRQDDRRRKEPDRG